MDSAKFYELYNKLNPQQREAVDTIEGPVVVIAGPGTGKTQILTLRIANILRKIDTEPANILALTFTESGAVAMRRRLVEIVGSPAYYVCISTFHGFCNEIIRSNPEDFTHLALAQSITEIEQIELLERLIKETSLEILKPYGATFLYLRPALKAINDLKRENMTPEKFKGIVDNEEKEFGAIENLYHEKGAHRGKMKGIYKIKERQIAKNKELAELYIAYQKALRDMGAYDYNDMILEVIAAMEHNADLLLRLQEQYQYVLVDEHQDTNSAQNRVLELLTGFHENPNLFVVGDEKQSIFRFQGASLANFLYFKKRYPSATLITLKESYRSTQTILDAASCLARGPGSSQVLLRDSMRLQAKGGHQEAKISVCSFSDAAAEFHSVAKDIEEKIANQTVKPEEIAILYRDNKDAFQVAEAFEKYDIPFVIESDENLLTDQDVKKLLIIFKAIEHFGEDPYLIPLLHVDFLKITPADAYELIAYAPDARLPLWKALRAPATYEKLAFENPEPLRALYFMLSSWRTLSKNSTLPEFFTRVLRESGLLGFILSRYDFINTMDKITGLFEEMKNFSVRRANASLGDFLAYLKTLEDQDILIAKKESYKRPGSVRLMTAHGSKGLEFDYVYIVKAHDGHWSNRRTVEHIKLPENILGALEGAAAAQSKDDDDRRLFYVALTRARKGVSISYSRHSPEGKEQLPAQFIEEIADDWKEMQGTDFENEFMKTKEILFAPKKITGPSIHDQEFIRQLFEKRGLSVTGLNNYLTCPWKYFYTNLLRVPLVPSKHQMFGIAVHEALRRFFDARNKGGNFTKEFLAQVFEEELKKQPLAPHDFDESASKGKRALEGYYEAWKKTWGSAATLNEFHIKVAFPLRESSVGQEAYSIRLQGKLDRVDVMNEKGEVVVTDYKTGKPKTRNYIEGLTKDSKGEYMRQLMFYKLLLEEYERGRMNMVVGRIDFVEPDQNGKLHREDFAISDVSVVELKTMVKQIATDILNVSFWEKRCGDVKCEFCALREMLSLPTIE